MNLALYIYSRFAVHCDAGSLSKNTIIVKASLDIDHSGNMSVIEPTIAHGTV